MLKQRRQILKWSVPVITSVALPAHAQTSDIAASSCSDSFAVAGGFVVNIGDLSGTSSADPVNGTGSDNTAQIGYFTPFGFNSSLPINVTYNVIDTLPASTQIDIVGPAQISPSDSSLTYTASVTLTNADFCTDVSGATYMIEVVFSPVDTACPAITIARTVGLTFDGTVGVGPAGCP